ncbi:MAG: hypothetical protein KGI10_03865 [Thaumarchaeota archaeon]|nr:hypothetical protein [Nitrososphaerota archaeon]
MNTFEQELKNNNFVCSSCLKCNKLVWPPSDFCNSCFGGVTWRQVEKTAKLVEFSRQGNEVFCIAEFEGNIRIMGSIKNASNLKVGQSLTLVKCDYDSKWKFILEPVI